MSPGGPPPHGWRDRGGLSAITDFHADAPAPARRRFTVEDLICISPDWQARRVGKRLLKRPVKENEKRGGRLVVAVISDGRVNLPSVRLHGALGFDQCGRIEDSGFKVRRWRDTVLMQRPLNGGATTLQTA